MTDASPKPYAIPINALEKLHNQNP